MKRRDFIKQFGKTATACGLGVLFAKSGLMSAPPSDRVTVAHIGVGGMGNSHVNWFSGFSDVNVAALCDLDTQRLNSTHAKLKKKRPDAAIDRVKDFRKIIERKDIDAVTVATPDHWHALISIHAFLAGKDVYSEKPLSYSIPEARAMLTAQKKNRAVFQLGTQIHAGDNYHRVVELVRSGILGKIHTVRVWKTGGAPMIPKVPDQDPPAGLDWDMWLGPRPSRPYNPKRCHFSYRYFWDYSGGVYADFWCHISDIVFWALKLGAPKTIQARGELNTRGMAETHRWLDVDFEFEGLKYYWTTQPPKVPGAAGRGIGAVFEGDKGHLVTDYGSRQIFFKGEKKPVTDVASVARSIPRSPGHQRDFINSVRSRQLTESHLAYAHTMTIPMHLGLIAFWTQRKLHWDGRKERFVNDSRADQYLTKTFRAPWKLPKV